jgi:hypothetical protein
MYKTKYPSQIVQFDYKNRHSQSIIHQTIFSFAGLIAYVPTVHFTYRDHAILMVTRAIAPAFAA